MQQLLQPGPATRPAHALSATCGRGVCRRPVHVPCSGMITPMTTEQPEQAAEPARERPRWTAAEAARRCGVGRATIQRALAAGRIPGAEQRESGWSIPIEGLLEAGFKFDGYRPHDTEQPAPVTPAREHDRASDEQARRVTALEQQLAESRRLGEMERMGREHAEALAAERAERIVDLRQALRQLEQAERPHTPPQSPQAHVQPDPMPTYAPNPVGPPTGRPPTLREYARTRYNVWRYR